MTPPACLFISEHLSSSPSHLLGGHSTPQVVSPPCTRLWKESSACCIPFEGCMESVHTISVNHGMVLVTTFFLLYQQWGVGVGIPAFTSFTCLSNFIFPFCLTNHFLEFTATKLTHIWRTRLLLYVKIHLSSPVPWYRKIFKVKCIILEYKMLTILLEKEGMWNNAWMKSITF